MNTLNPMDLIPNVNVKISLDIYFSVMKLSQIEIKYIIREKLYYLVCDEITEQLENLVWDIVKSETWNKIEIDI